jgi:uncharacterized membrane-anchored protein YhcB (DUF1043 family)
MKTIATLLFAVVGFLCGAFIGGLIARTMAPEDVRNAQGLAVASPAVFIGGVVGIVVGFLAAKHLVHSEVP